MKRVFLLLGTVFLFSITACVMTQPKLVAVAFDAGDIPRVEKSKTYHWSLPDASEINPYNNQDLYLSLLKADIDAQLAKKGYKLVNSGGDLEVSFLLLYKEGADTSVVDHYFGTNREPERRMIKTLNKLPDTKYEIGTLVVDAEDASDHESLWRGAVSSKVDRSKPFDAQKTLINRAVELVMSGFPRAK